MRKDQLKIVKDSKGRVEDLKQKFSDFIDTSLNGVDEEIEVIGNLIDALQAQFDELSDTQQEAEKGTAITDEIESLGEIKDELESIKDELASDDFDDAIAKYDTIAGVE